MKILITGSKGQLGQELLSLTNETIIDTDIELNIVDLDTLYRFVKDKHFDAIINCAAYTNVDGCEDNIDDAYHINAVGARNLALIAEQKKAKLFHISTDYVFDGLSKEPYREYDVPNPQSVYGKSKLLGEHFVRDFCGKYFIIRTAWLYSKINKNFVQTMISLGQSKNEINVVNDQRGNPTNVKDLANHILSLLRTDYYGIYHITGKGECSWYDFAKRIMELSGSKCRVNPITSKEYPQKAKRPKYSSLDNLALRASIGDHMRDWDVALEDYFKEMVK